MNTPVPRTPRRTLLRRLLKVALILALVALLAAVIAGGTVFFIYRQLAATYDITKLGQMPSHSQVFDGDGKPYGRLQNDQNRVVVPIKDVSPRFIDAIVAREDSRFWEHHGVDFHGIARAFLRNARSGGTREGASTITQQLARNSFSLGGQNLHRKLIEAMVARRIEDKYSKSQILEFYLNRIYLGSGVYGIEAASQKYFGKPAKDLSLGEAALIAGIVRNPNRNSPLKNMEGARADRDSVLDRLVTLQKISAQDAAAAKAAPLVLASPKAAPLQEDYVLDAVRAELDDLVGADAINAGGLKIYTTIDPHLQQLAADAVEDQLANIERTKGYSHLTREQYRTEVATAATGGDKTKTDASPEYLQGALLAIDNRSGAILALVGGRNFEESRYNRALLARRQVGSTFKPFVYAAAFDHGLLPESPVEDSPLRPGEIPDAPRDWKPANSDSNFLGVQPAEIGLIQSRNIMSIRVGEMAGMGNVLALAKRAGLPDVPRLPSVYLGSFEASLKNLTAAYTAFPNHGVVRPAYLVERIDAANGQPIYQAEHREVKVMSEQVAQTTSEVLERVLTEGTGRQAASFGFRVPGAGKTGTTNDYKDAWFVGYTTSLTCGVWVGMDKPQTITAKGYGATLALPIWADFMQSSVTSTKRFPALALHPGGSLTPEVRMVSAPAAVSARPFASASTGIEPPETNPAPAANYQPPADPGSHLIVDPRTGRVVGIDGTASATQEEARQLQLQQQQLQLREMELRRQQDLLRQQPPRGLVYDDPNAPVRRALPVVPADGGVGQPGYPNTVIPRARPVDPGTQRVFDPSTNRFITQPGAVRAQPAAPEPSGRTHRRIFTLPDGTQVTEDELNGGR